jgi:hypothetical protein
MSAGYLSAASGVRLPKSRRGSVAFTVEITIQMTVNFLVLSGMSVIDN